MAVLEGLRTQGWVEKMMEGGFEVWNPYEAPKYIAAYSRYQSQWAMWTHGTISRPRWQVALEAIWTTTHFSKSQWRAKWTETFQANFKAASMNGHQGRSIDIFNNLLELDGSMKWINSDYDPAFTYKSKRYFVVESLTPGIYGVYWDRFEERVEQRLQECLDLKDKFE
jgi:hypothetical protein